MKEFINAYHFNHLGVFTYSKEEGTYGATLPNQIDEEEKERRKSEIMKEQARISYIENKKLINKVFKGLVIKVNGNNVYSLRSGINAPDEIDGEIYMKSNINHKEGDIVYFKISEAFVYDLYSEEVIN